jgi:pilus assembly protein CpaE
MAQLLRVLVATADEGARALIMRTTAECPGLRVVAEVATEEALLETVERRRPQLIFLSTDLADGKGMELASTLSRKYAGLFVAMLSSQAAAVDVSQDAMRAGARACLFAPLSEADIRMAADAAWDTGEVVAPHRGVVLTVMSSKGGVGKSTVATNLAIALKEGQGNRVALVDADLHFGDAAILMNITPKITVHDLIASLDTEIADRFLIKHPSGVEVLAAPLRTEQAEVMSPDRFRDLLGILQEVYDTIVVDASLSSLDAMLSALEMTDLAILVTTLDVVTLKDVRQVLDVLNDLQFPTQNLLLVGNRHDGRVSLDPQQVEKAIGMKFAALLPHDQRVTLAGNRGIPMLVSEPRAPFSQRVRELAKTAVAGLERKDNTHSRGPLGDREPDHNAGRQLSGIAQRLRGIGESLQDRLQDRVQGPGSAAR